MKNLFGLVLFGMVCTGLFSGCDSEIPEVPLTFHGQIRNGDLNSHPPLRDIWVKIRYYDEGFRLIKADSVTTNESGSYFFQIRNNEQIKQYSIVIRDEYFFECANFMEPLISDFVIPQDIDKHKANADTIDACITGKVRLIFTKLNASSKDTLTFIPKIKTGSFTLIKYPTTVYSNREQTDYYFSEWVSSVEYKFEVKKESGETNTWATTTSIEAGKTKELMVPF